MANLLTLVPQGRTLTEEESSKIEELQDEIDIIWSKRGEYKIDENAWKTMPLFMDNITEDDVQKNENCAAIASIVYEDVPPEEIAENRKTHGNDCLTRAMNPDQVNKDNIARAAIHCYTEGIQAAKDKVADKKIVAQLYGNRSMAHFLMKNYGHAMQDAQKAIIMDLLYVKAYFRAAKAAERTRKFEIGLKIIENGLDTLTREEVNEKDKEKVKAEFLALRKTIEEEIKTAALKEKKEKMKTRVEKADTTNLLRAITSAGIKISPAYEVGKDQLSQYQLTKPYFSASDNILHIPILFIYDQFSQSDYMQDVSTDFCMAEVLDELMPFPWDAEGHYRKLEDIITVFKIDDSVNMPQYHAFDLGWPLIEVMRMPEYKMPMLLSVVHIISKRCTDLIEKWGLEGKIPN